MLQAIVLLWAWHLPNQSTGLIFASVGLIAISSGNILPSSHGIVNLYALFGGSCLLSLFVLSGALYHRRDQPFRERCWQTIMILSCIAIIGVGTWYISVSLQRIGDVIDALLADFIYGSPDEDRIGAGDSIHITHQRQVKPSRRVVATISGNRSPVYLRTQVMTQYHGHRWKPATSPSPQPLYRDQNGGRARTQHHRGYREMRLHVNLQGAVPLPYNVANVHLPESLSCLQMPGDTVQCSPFSPLTSYSFERLEHPLPVPYGIGLALNTPASNASLSTMAPSLQQALNAPESVLSQLRPLARQIVGPDMPHTLVAAQQIQQHFRNYFTYSYQVELSPELDPIVDFVRHRRPAYCEYFASGMALMLRALGIPARIVGGFLVWEYNALMQQWIVRQRDAHAWVEVYDDLGQRWVGFDATPAFRQQQFARTGLVSFLDQSRDWVDLQIRLVIKTIYHIDYLAWIKHWRQPQKWLWPLTVRSLVLAGVIAAIYGLWRGVHRLLNRWYQNRRDPRHRRTSEPLGAAQIEAQEHFAHLATLMHMHGLPISCTETLEEYVERIRTRDITKPDGPIWSSPVRSLHLRDQKASDVPPTCIDLLTDFRHAYHQVRFHHAFDQPERCHAYLKERLMAIRSVMDQLQQIQRNGTIKRPSNK
jgi:hypothetical protein